MRKIDLFNHIVPPNFYKTLVKKAKDSFYMGQIPVHPGLTDLDIRFREMDKHGDYKEVLTLPHPGMEMEDIINPADAVDLARMANDELAELVAKYPDRFIGAAACLPLGNMDAALKETDRAIKELHLKGVQIYTPLWGKSLDTPELMPLYQKMQDYDLPIWIHPAGDPRIPEYPAVEKESKMGMFALFGWPYQTTLAMGRLVISGTMEKFPKIKFVTHHCGAMVPSLCERIAWAGITIRTSFVEKDAKAAEMAPPPLDYFRRFYVDTALQGNVPGLMCGYAFYGADHMVLATDFPFGGKRFGERLKREIDAIDMMKIPKGDKEKIYFKNALKLLNLKE